MTPTPTDQRPQECKHWCDGKCGLTSSFIRTDKGLALNVWCRGANCPDYEPKEKKDNGKTDNVG